MSPLPSGKHRPPPGFRRPSSFEGDADTLVAWGVAKTATSYVASGATLAVGSWVLHWPWWAGALAGPIVVSGVLVFELRRIRRQVTGSRDKVLLPAPTVPQAT
jgi:hypothetical protein